MATKTKAELALADANVGLKNQNIFLTKLVSYHEATIQALRDQITNMESLSKQMQVLLVSSHQKLVELEAEKNQKPVNPLLEMIGTRSLKRGR